MQIKTKAIPNEPGIYMFKNKNNEIIYIGKAKSLKNRVTTYFNNSKKDIKTTKLVSEIKDIETIITKNEIEAFILESSLIKKHKPKYNILLKDSKGYSYIQITDENFPRIITARKKPKTGIYFGPYPNSTFRKEIIHTLRRVFLIRTCRKLPKKPCLRYQINLCNAPCIQNETKDEYNKRISKVITYLKGNNKELIKLLEKEMHYFSQIEQFEKAIQIKKELEAIEYLSEKQIIEQQNTSNQDVINYIKYKKNKKELVKIIIFSVRNGILVGKDEYELEYYKEFLTDFIKIYYEEHEIPSDIIIPKEIEDKEILEKYLENIKKKKISILIPKKGLKKELLKLAKKNIEIKINSYELTKQELIKNLKLKNNAEIIECFDISHISGSDMVGSMVCFKNGIPDKSNYRRFKIKTINYVDDFRAMGEVVKRRYSRIKKDISENKDNRYPDLIVIDGGKIQLKFAVNELIKLNLKIPIVALAKKNEEIYFPGLDKPILFDKNSNMMKLLINIRDEAHRFAITYHKLRRKKRYEESG